MRMRSVALLMLIATPGLSAWSQGRGIDLDTMTPGQAAVEEDAHGDAGRGDSGRVSEWRFAVGGGLAVVPTYSGSDNYRLRAVPLGQATYKRFFVGASGIGAIVYRDRNWQFRANLAPSRGRAEDDDSHLRGLGDIDSTLRAGLFGSYRTRHIDTRLQINSDVAGRGQGTLVRLDVAYFALVNSRLYLSVGPGITWASNEYTQSLFGVTAEQSARSGLPVFAADGGVNSLRLSAAALYRFSYRWIGSASVSVSELHGDAARSPITHATTQTLLFAGALYRF